MPRYVRDGRFGERPHYEPAELDGEMRGQNLRNPTPRTRIRSGRLVDPLHRPSAVAPFMHSTQFIVYWPDTNPPRLPDSDSSILLLVLVVAALTRFRK